MESIKKIVLEHFEGLFIILILTSVGLINYLVYSKTAFLNFYYLPVMIAGYYLGKRMAVLGAFFVALMIWAIVLTNQDNFISPPGPFDLYFHLAVWGSFLILAGGLIGHLSERFKTEMQHSRRLQKELAQEKDRLDETNQQLNEYSARLENKVQERTQELERSNATIETLKSQVEEALYSVMDAKVARLMIEGKLRNEKRRISILFSDLKDFTAYSDQNPPEKVVDELNVYLTEMEDSITRYYGHIDKYMGDGIMVEFGAPISYKMHSLMAVLAGLHMQKRVKECNFKWQMRVGIATGSSVIGLFGSRRKSYSCIGDTANMASRLEHLAEPGEIYIDEETYQDVKPYILASRVRALFGQRATDTDLDKKIKQLEQDVARDPQNRDKRFELGRAFLERREASAAMDCFQKVLEQDPNHTEAKVAYAEASMKQDEYEKISIKGKRDRLAVYQVMGLKDAFLDREKIPEHFYQAYQHVPDRIQIPQEVILPVESLDGTVGHGRMVAIFAFALADRLGLSEYEKEQILIAAMLHDIGNVIIPHELLDSNRNLTDTERELIKKHPAESVKVLKQMGYQSEPVLSMVAAHHENYDGSGYPAGLKGEDIPLGARILAVADAFDSLTSLRLHRESWEYKSAIREIQKEAQQDKYDRQVVDALNSLFET